MLTVHNRGLGCRCPLDRKESRRTFGNDTNDIDDRRKLGDRTGNGEGVAGTGKYIDRGGALRGTVGGIGHTGATV